MVQLPKCAHTSLKKAARESFGYRFDLYQGNPFQRRSPHSEKKQAKAKANIAGVCQSGEFHASITGACRCCRFRTKSSNFSARITSPPVFCAILVSKAVFGVSERNSSAAR